MVTAKAPPTAPGSGRTPNAAAVLDRNDNVIVANAAWSMLREEALAAIRIALPAGRDPVLSGKLPEYCVDVPAGSRHRWARIRISPCATHPDAIVLTYDDITEYVAGKLHVSQMRSLIGRTNTIMMSADSRRQLAFINTSLQRLSGFALPEFAATAGNLFALSGFSPAEAGRVARALDEGKGFRAELRAQAKDGTPYYLDMDVQPVHDEDGSVLGWFSLGHDVTEASRLRDRLSAYEARLGLALESARMGTWQMDAATGEAIVDDGWLNLAQIPRDSERSVTEIWVERIHPADQVRMRERIEGAIVGTFDVEVSEYRILLPDGTVLWIQDTCRIIERTPDGRPARLVGVVADITGLKQAVQNAERIAERLSLGADAADLGVWDHDLVEGRYYWNERMRDIHGLSIQEESLAAYEGLIHPDDQARVKAEIAAIRAPGESYRTQFRVIRPDGGLRHLESHAILHKTPDGKLTRATGVTMDLTERIRQETERHLAQKLLSIGRLSAGIAHEINTPSQYVGDNLRFAAEAFNTLATLFGALSTGQNGAEVQRLLQVALTDPETMYLLTETPRAIEQAREGMERITGIVRAMKDFSHPANERVAIDINRAIASTVAVAKGEWRYVAELECNFDPHLPHVPVMPGDFNQVILNLLVNAAQAIADSREKDPEELGRITITTRRRGDTLELLVADTGCGMTPDVQAKIFDPFFTTKPVGKGTGQGLALAHNVVTSHGGTIDVQSQPGKGTCFTVRLPLSGTADKATADNAPVKTGAASTQLA